MVSGGVGAPSFWPFRDPGRETVEGKGAFWDPGCALVTYVGKTKEETMASCLKLMTTCETRFWLNRPNLEPRVLVGPLRVSPRFLGAKPREYGGVRLRWMARQR